MVALIPKEYSDTSSSTWETSDGELLGFTFTAAPDIAKFNDSWAEPGLIVKSALDMTEALDLDEMLADDSLTENCTYDERYTDEHTINGVTYQVAYDVYTKCGDTDSGYVYGIAQTDPPDQALLHRFWRGQRRGRGSGGCAPQDLCRGYPIGCRRPGCCRDRIRRQQETGPGLCPHHR